jgi:hypothetical protein
METRFQTTSFIPKTSLDNVVSENGKLQKKPNHSTTTGNLVLLLCFFLFVCSLVSAGTVFFLGRLTESTKVQLTKVLEDFKKRNTAETLVDLTNLNDRLSLVNNLIRDHVAVSPLFDILAANTLSRVSFNNFDLKKKTDGSFTLSLKAQGIGYESIVAQDTQFSSAFAQKTFKNTVINDFSKAKNQSIAVFNLTTTVPASVAKFTKFVNLATAPIQATSSKANLQ